MIDEAVEGQDNDQRVTDSTLPEPKAGILAGPVVLKDDDDLPVDTDPTAVEAALGRLNSETLLTTFQEQAERFASGLRDKARNLAPEAKEDNDDGSCTGEWRFTDERGVIYRSTLRFRKEDSGEIVLLGYQLDIGREHEKKGFRRHKKFEAEEGSLRINFAEDKMNYMTDMAFTFINNGRGSDQMLPNMPPGRLHDYMTGFAPLFMHYEKYYDQNVGVYYNTVGVHVQADNPRLTFSSSTLVDRAANNAYIFNPHPEVNAFVPPPKQNLIEGSPRKISRETFMDVSTSMLSIVPIHIG